MNKYLIGSTYNVPMVSSEVPSGSLLSVAWTMRRVSPVETVADETLVTGDFLAVDNPTGTITLPNNATHVGTRSVWRLTYTLTNNLTVAYPYTVDFILEAQELLVKGANSFMDYFEAMLTAEEVSGVEFFKGAAKADQITALTTAYQILCTMVYGDNTGDHYDIGGYDATRLDTLEPGLLRALRIAMVLEANEMLDGNSLHYKRQDGLMSETIGESSMMFRPGNIQNFPVTRRSMNFLRNYVVIRARLYRG